MERVRLLFLAYMTLFVVVTAEIVWFIVLVTVNEKLPLRMVKTGATPIVPPLAVLAQVGTLVVVNALFVTVATPPDALTE